MWQSANHEKFLHRPPCLGAVAKREMAPSEQSESDSVNHFHLRTGGNANARVIYEPCHTKTHANTPIQLGVSGF
jgi:hypothetical protein